MCVFSLIYLYLSYNFLTVLLYTLQISIDSQDNHDKTREYMWRRTARIASLVAQKLTSATRSMLKPPPRGRQSH